MLELVEEPVPRPERRKPAQLHREHREQQDRGDERGHCRADRRADDHRRVGEPPLQAGENAETDADDDDQHARVGDQLDRCADPLGDQGRHVLAERDRTAEVTVRRRPQPADVSEEERVTEVISLLEDLDRFW